MFRFKVESHDLAASRFALSPLMELDAVLRLLGGLSDARGRLPPAVHERFERRYAPLRGDPLVQALELLRTPRHGVTFLTPPPGSLGQTVDDDVAQVRATPPEVAIAEIAEALARRARGRHVAGPADAVARWVESLPGESLVGQLADTLEELWRCVVGPDWPLLRAVAERDVLHRAQRLTSEGWAGALDDIHPRVRWRAPYVEVLGHPAGTVDLDGRGLLLVPSVFVTSGVAVYADRQWRAALVYPARGHAALWSSRRPPGAAVERLLGRGRARILLAVDTGASTTQLARELELSPAGVSAHLGVLLEAGLLTRSRMGRTVVYRRSPLGDALAAAGDDDPVPGTAGPATG
ncbi:helix-turn-helix domain-containing protein [Nocardioides acrostichi]|uniref:Winged helix-turn-helix transcriptional regulator n=1 Tax=Nocardioides acrostichi TaxID=2784339 RepID=A0A930UZC0_9ACTN|nr:winged helix-turn-helix domain-containing protein [Nocardioides acrostichi]MBF4160815.1 winged helix-turn-helix transcriptional regulator [Nocardioides acrostichi]